MRYLTGLLSLLGLLLSLVAANEVSLNEVEWNQQRCSGMYSRLATGGKIKPFIEVSLPQPIRSEENQVVALIIFEWTDVNRIGRVVKNVTESEYGWVEYAYVCDESAISLDLCEKSQYGQFLLDPSVGNNTRSIYTTSIHLNDTTPIKYPVSKTGYYCVGTAPLVSGEQYDIVVEWRNAYGELAAADYPKLPFYGGLALLYAILGFGWGFLYWQHRDDSLPVQNYITAIIIYLFVEQVLVWGYYDYVNVHGMNIGARVFQIVLSVLNAGRVSLSFFILLIVALGFGVVKQSLGPTMWKCRLLAIVHFVFGVAFAIASYNVTEDTAGWIFLAIVLPLAATMTAFYLWILTGLTNTRKDLERRKQSAKALMYRRLWRLLVWSISILMFMFFLNSVVITMRDEPDFLPSHWKSQWFVLDGWMSVLYLAVLGTICYLWRPTANNRRFAMSEEISQEEDDVFELGDREGDDDLEEGSANGDSQATTLPDKSIPRTDTSTPMALQAHRAESARPDAGAPSSSSRRIENEEGEIGETLFAVGDDDDFDRWTEDEGDDEDIGTQRLVKKNNDVSKKD
ncbi:Membrane protein ptm1 [Saitoella coloradoensis]